METEFETLAGDVVQRANDGPALVVLPARIAGLPVPAVRFPGFDQVVLVAVVVEGSVEINVGEKVLGGIGSLFQETFPAAQKTRIVTTVVDKTSVSPKIPARLVRRFHHEGSVCPVHETGGLARIGHGADGHKIALPEPGGPGPFSRGIGRKVHAPGRTFGCGGVCGITIGAEMARDPVFPLRLCVPEDHVQSVIGERVDLVGFGHTGPLKSQGDPVPGLQFPG